MSNASVQAVRLSVRAIEGDVIQLTSGAYRAVLEVTGTAGPLDDEVRQTAVLAGFAAFLNALSFPVQILVRAVPVDLAGYVASIEEHAARGLAGHLSSLAHEHAVFVQGLARQRSLLERRFFIVVPAQSSPATDWSSRLLGRTTRSTEPEREAACRQLSFRCDEVIRQLVRCGLSARRLNDLELAQLYLTCWSPERARVQRFRQRLDDYTTLAVRQAGAQ